MADMTALIPLDTTEFSETAFLLVPALHALGFTRARLVAALDDKQRKQGKTVADLEDYLKRQSMRPELLGMDVETRVAEGDAAEVCIAAAAEPDVDLVLVATHGRTGLARLRFGSVGEKLIKDASCPRLVIGPNVDIDLGTYSIRRVLVPLDGSEVSEMSLPIARHIASLAGAEVDLLRSISLTTVPADPMMAGVDTLTPLQDEARDYLAAVSATFPDRKVNTTLLLGRAGDNILDHLKEHPVDLVIMVSRGRTGVGRLAMGSVAERVLQGPDPVLIFEPGEDRSRLFEAARSG